MHVVVKAYSGSYNAVFTVENSEQLRQELAGYGDGEFSVTVDGQELGPAYAAADELERREAEK